MKIQNPTNHFFLLLIASPAFQPFSLRFLKYLYNPLAARKRTFVITKLPNAAQKSELEAQEQLS
jgi:hypothetical protein